jgi:biopolymer transport protein ExbB/TolQ
VTGGRATVDGRAGLLFGLPFPCPSFIRALACLHASLAAFFACFKALTEYHLKNNPVHVGPAKSAAGDDSPTARKTARDNPARQVTTKISAGSFDQVRVSLERAASTQALALEKGMIILSTAVAGGPFIGLLGTVWGVMETFSGIARANAASLTAMAPGVAGALIATVVGLFVAIPAMFAYNYMVTMVRGITQELDSFASEYAAAIEHRYVDNPSLVDELREALRPEAKEPLFGEPAFRD